MPARIAQTDAFKQRHRGRWAAARSASWRTSTSSGSLTVFRQVRRLPRHGEEAPSAWWRAASGCWWTGWNGASSRKPATAAERPAKTGEVDWLEHAADRTCCHRFKAAPQRGCGPAGPVWPVSRCCASTASCTHPRTTTAACARPSWRRMDPVEVMQAVMGDDASMYNAPVGCVPAWHPLRQRPRPWTAWATKKSDSRTARHGQGVRLQRRAADPDASQTDQPFYDAMSQVAAARR